VALESATPFRGHNPEAGVRRRASGHTPKARKSPQTAASRWHRTNISKAALSVRVSSIPGTRQSQIQRAHSRSWGSFRRLLFAYAAKSRVDILIMRLKPVAERPAKHRGFRARRTALHHVMFGIEEVCGVARLNRKGLESLEGREDSRRPLPSVSQQAGHIKRAAAPRKCIHW